MVKFFCNITGRRLQFQCFVTVRKFSDIGSSSEEGSLGVLGNMTSCIFILFVFFGLIKARMWNSCCKTG